MSVTVERIPAKNQSFDIGRVINLSKPYDNWREGENYALKMQNKLMSVSEYVAKGGELEDKDSEWLIDAFENFLNCCSSKFPKGLFYEGTNEKSYLRLRFIRAGYGREINVGTTRIYKNGEVTISGFTSKTDEKFAEKLANKMGEFYQITGKSSIGEEK